MKIEDIKKEITICREELLRITEKLSPRVLEFSPGPERWSISQVLDHISIAQRRIAALIDQLIQRNREAVPATNLSREEVTELTGLKKFEENITSVEVVPGTEPGEGKSREILLEQLADSQAFLEGALEKALAGDYRHVTYLHPAAGELSIYQWFLFTTLHERGHILQIKRILDSFRE